MKKIISISIILLLLTLTSCNDAVTDPPKLPPVTTPVITFLTPAHQSVALDSAVIEVDATDDKGIIKVEIYIDNFTSAERTILIKPYRYLWITPQTTDSSSHLIYAKAYDADDNVTSTDVRTITVQKFQAPTDLQITAMTTTQVQLSWNDNASAETGFEIEQSSSDGTFSLVKTVGMNVRTATIDGVFDSVSTYIFRVRAIASGKKSAYSNTASRSLLLGKLQLVSGGTFVMGSNVTWINGANPPHSVTLLNFSIGWNEVTWELWNTVRQWGLNNGYTDLPAGNKGYSNGTTQHPVTMVNWFDALKWCNARSQMDGITPVYYLTTTFSAENIYKTGEPGISISTVNTNANGYRLPTEAEWEYAAQGGPARHSPPFMYSGSNLVDSVAWFSANAGGNTHPVGTKGANEIGLYDMSGNVMEWCWDWYSTYPSTSQTSPTGPISGTAKIIRGGATHHEHPHSHIANRNSTIPSVRDGDVGFRVCRSK